VQQLGQSVALADFDEALVDYLVSRPGPAALVAKRIFPDYFPQSEQLPAIACTLEDESSPQTQQGASGMREAVYQFNVWADTRRSGSMTVGVWVRALREKNARQPRPAIPAIRMKIFDPFFLVTIAFRPNRVTAGLQNS